MNLLRVIIAISGLVYLVIACNFSNKPTDYELELNKINNTIRQLERDLDSSLRAKEKSSDTETIVKLDTKKIVKLTYQYYLKASLTADYVDFSIAEKKINEAMEQMGRFPDLFVFRANLNFKLHRLDRARADLELLADNAEIKGLKADIALQEGRYDDALSKYQHIIEEYPSWDNYARLAFLKLHTGSVKQADQLYQQAVDDLTAKQMRSYAWVELQRGLMDLQYQRYVEAFKHYQRANRAYSGYWLIEEHMAEVLDLLGRTDEAIEMYEKIIAKTQNPEFIGALADIINRTDPKAAESLYIKAHQLYSHRLELYPEAVGGHLIEHLLSREKADENLLVYAKNNHQLRPNAEAKFLLAQAYLKFNDSGRAKRLFMEIAATPWRTPEIQRVLTDQNIAWQ